MNVARVGAAKTRPKRLSCLALQLYTALVCIFFTWLFLRPSRSRRNRRGRRAAPGVRRARANVGADPAPDAETEPEPFLDPQTIADWEAQGTLLAREAAITLTPASARRAVPSTSPGSVGPVTSTRPSDAGVEDGAGPPARERVSEPPPNDPSTDAASQGPAAGTDESGRPVSGVAPARRAASVSSLAAAAQGKGLAGSRAARRRSARARSLRRALTPQPQGGH